MNKSLLLITVLTSCLIVSADLIAQDSRSRSRRSNVPRPFLYAFPEKPGESPLAEVRKSMLEKFDADKDGFLNKTERNTMRLATKKFSDGRHDEIRRARESRGGRSSSSPKPPERWLAAYDKNKNGRFDGSEWDTARGTEIKNVTARYDANKNGKIDDNEKQRLLDNLKKNNYNPYDNYIRMIVAGIRGDRSGSSGDERRSRWKQFDTNGDGKASREELAAIREHESQAQDKP